jgi:uncharacterized phage-associated protein
MGVMALSQLLPFNEGRFDACMAYLARKHQRLLTKYDMVKIHVMADVLHVLEHGKPIIGGAISPWQFGPVVARAYKRLRAWECKFDEIGAEPENYSIAGRAGNSLEFRPTLAVEADDFSPSELTAMEGAWQKVMEQLRDFQESQQYFHGSGSFIGRAWNKARLEGRDLDWEEVIAEYEKEGDLAHPEVKTLIRF